MITFVRLLTFLVPVVLFVGATLINLQRTDYPWFILGIVGAIGVYGGGMLMAHEMRGDYR